MVKFFVALVVRGMGEVGWMLTLAKRLRTIRRSVYHSSKRAFLVDIPIDQFSFFKLQDTGRSSI